MGDLLAPLTVTVLGTYTLLTVVGVAGISGVLALVRLRSAFLPIRTWLLMLPVVLGALWLGLGAWAVLVTVVSVLGFKEYARATGLYRERPQLAIVYIAILVENLAAAVGRYDVFMATPMWAVFLLALIPILRGQVERSLQWFSLAVLGVLLYGFFLSHLTYLAGSPLGLGYLLFVVLGTQLNDALGFIWGKTLGRRRWTPISPNKTVEGSLLALATTVVLAFAQWGFAFPQLPVAGVLLAGLIVGVGGQIGDLTMAGIKRNIGIKDWGTLLPGHGGITDRVNSLMVTAPVFAHMIGFLWGGWPLAEPGWIRGMGV
jgi:phosphatidate cytidylyltransferase